MKNTNKGFTLVELIVVITILAILGTIAFISLQGYSQDAKNTKVTSDLSQLSSKVNIRISEKDNVDLKDLVVSDAGHRVPNGSSVFNNSYTLTGGTNYDAGTINFANLKENRDKFKDSDGNDYLFGYTAKGKDAGFQVVGQVKDGAGNYQAKVDGSYYTGTGSDVAGLVSASGASNTGAIIEDADLGSAGLY